MFDGPIPRPRHGYFQVRLPPPRPAVKRTIDLPVNAARNAALLQSQVRASGGMTQAVGLLNLDGALSMRAMDRVLPGAHRPPVEPERWEPPELAPSGTEASRRYGSLLRHLERLARLGQGTESKQNIRDCLNFSYAFLEAGLVALAREGDIVLRMSERRPGVRCEMHVVVPHVGVTHTPGWREGMAP